MQLKRNDWGWIVRQYAIPLIFILGCFLGGAAAVFYAEGRRQADLAPLIDFISGDSPARAIEDRCESARPAKCRVA